MLTNLVELNYLNASINSGIPLVKENFVFFEELGVGAFGKVYKVRSRATNTEYALKVLSKAQIEGMRLFNQLQNEIRILARCNHKNIIKLYSAFEDKDYVYLLLELAVGGSLYNKLKEQKRFNETTTASYMTDIIKAVSHLHNMTPPIIHRDLKPENVLLADGVLKIADFGWSNMGNDIRNTFCGTPEYLSPEMLTGSGHNEKLDIWTLGVLMYEMLHGKPPFSPTDTKNPRILQREIENNIMQGKVQFDDNISKEAKEVINAMLDPIDKCRPFCKSILGYDFFVKHNKTIQTNGKPSNPANIPVLSSSSTQSKIEDYESQIKQLNSANRQLAEVCKQKDQIIAENILSIDLLKRKLSQTVK